MSSTIEMQGQFPYKPSIKRKLSWLLLFPIIIRLATMPMQFIGCVEEQNWYGVLHSIMDLLVWCIALTFTLFYISFKKEPQCSSITFVENQEALEIASSFYKIVIKWDRILRASYSPSTHLLHIRFSDADKPKTEIIVTAYCQDKADVVALSRMIHDHASIFILEK